MRNAELFSRFFDSVSPFRQPYLRIVHTIRTMRGQYRSKLALCDDGELYVVKEEGQLTNSNLLANEVIGACLLRGLGIMVPEYRVIICEPARQVTDPLNNTQKQESIRPGHHLGSRYAGGSQKRVYDYLPYQPSDFASYDVLGVLLFDLWCMNLDARQYVYVIDNRRKTREIVFIDNSEICGGPHWSFKEPRQGKCFLHPQLDADLAPGYVSGWCSLLNQRIPPLLEMTLRELPKTWYKGDLIGLEQTLRSRLASLQDIVKAERQRQRLCREVLMMQRSEAETTIVQ